jgi:hypothetical protein
MSTTKRFIILLGLVFLMACGPETIWLRPGLDTPSHHITNGHIFLKNAKISDAHREFTRAKELDPKSVEAYIGIALVKGHLGHVDDGLQHLQKAKALARTPEEHAAVRQGFERFHAITTPQNQTPQE